MSGVPEPLLFESTDSATVREDPVNEAWLAVVARVDGERFEELARRYYIALYHFRKQTSRPQLPGMIEVTAQGKDQAFLCMLEMMEQRKLEPKDSAGKILFDAGPDSSDASLPEVVRDFSKKPQSLAAILSGPGRPPCDALCLLRAFLAAPLLCNRDDPTSVHMLLHSNPSFARHCGFLGSEAVKQPGELTSRRLPSLSVCEEFSEVMTRYGLWHLARLEQVRANIKSGAVEVEETVCFDTTHVEANSHCGNVVPPTARQNSDEDAKSKHRKVPRMRKRCDCGQAQWETCKHPWTPTDQGAAVVVKGHTRIYWAHKASVAVFADSEIPFDVKVCQYAAESDGKTLVPHLELLETELPEVVEGIREVVVDDAYQGNQVAVMRFGQQARLILPVHPRRVSPTLAEAFDGINRFTAIGTPVCEAGFRFELRGRDIHGEHYIWVAPDDDQGRAVCVNCQVGVACRRREGERRNIRVDRRDLPQIDWDHPQHFARNRARYAKRTAAERAIKRLKIDLHAEYLTHRDAHRVQAHFDRKLLTLHLLLAAAHDA